MVGDRKAGEFRTTNVGVGVGGQERRSTVDRRQGLERRQHDGSVPVDQRIGFDRRTLRDRREPLDQRRDSPALGLRHPRPTPVPLADDSPPFAPRLKQLAHVDLTEAEAERHWRAIARHRRNLVERLGRDAGQEVATLDYFLNVSPRLTHPTVIETDALASIERDAIVDPLTGLFNRGFFKSSLRREVERCRRHRVMSSLLLLDLDHFKATNDRFGHGTGDLALQALGELMYRHLRAVDVPCRYGGDEFAVILPDTEAPAALAVAERITGDVNRHFRDVPVDDHRLGLTVSGGGVSFSAGGWDGPGASPLDALVAAADRALYVAKGQGGGRVSWGGSA
ncbi:MAG TPA: GGDEF domain-containing protein [Gemmatimonadales bacterium]|jgi:diguanylate cyclase (GGDEF)-like protein|nr:GGDEF domain-containing protein [Gemmatimonadales bacterium]